MSTSILYHSWGLRNTVYVSTNYRKGATIFNIKHSMKSLKCSICGSKNIIKKGTVEREFRTLPVGSRPTLLSLPVQRVECRDCNHIRQVKIGFADEKCSHTHSFVRYALDLLKGTTIKFVAHHLGVSWDVIKGIQKRHLTRRYSKPKLRNLKYIAIDEVNVGKGKFLTIVLNLLSGAVVFVGTGRDTDALLPFWKRLKASKAKIKAVAMDMGRAYIAAAKEHLKKVDVVFDRFHVMKLMNDKLTKLRSKIQKEATTKLGKKTIKGTRWLLVSNSESLEVNRIGNKLSQREQLERALKINEPLACAYYLKEDLRLFWAQESKEAAQQFLQDWIDRAMESGIKLMKTMAKTLATYRYGLIAWYKHQISTGPLEGLNNKIGAMQRQSYGIRDQDFLKLKIYGLHETKYALIG